MKTKLILIAIAFMVGIAALFRLVSNGETAHDNRSTFFGPTNDYPTSGGEKMKVEW
ncbi:entry exclusion protein TrbK [Mesorhizobium sp.]|uniref:entry exclusion protein TrbK n=1 Tax=Mesorhizobium sp. TaxID=1871066 RepID=UPI0025F23481|nr:entry exclusion protein TrbK [Mesorhizobium sp.]